MTPPSKHRTPFIASATRDALQRIAARVDPVVAGVRAYLASEMTYLPDGWPATGDSAWNDERVAEAQRRHWPTLVANLEGPGSLGVSHYPWSTTRENRVYHNTMMSYGYVLARASRQRDCLSVLDWGSGAGHYYLYSRALLPDLTLDFHCYDLPPLCRVGRGLLPNVAFHDDADDPALVQRTYDLVVTSGALHYVEHWQDVVRRLASLTGEFLYVARLQTVRRSRSFAAVHRVNRAGYSEFASWCLNRDELVGCAESAALALVREFVHGEPWTVRGAPERPDTRGFLFRPR